MPNCRGGLARADPRADVAGRATSGWRVGYLKRAGGTRDNLVGLGLLDDPHVLLELQDLGLERRERRLSFPQMVGARRHLNRDGADGLPMLATLPEG